MLSTLCSVDLQDLKNSIEQKVKVTHPQSDTSSSEEITLDTKSRSLLQLSVLESRLMRSTQIDVEHLLLAILKQKNNIPATILSDHNISYSQLYKALKSQQSEIKNDDKAAMTELERQIDAALDDLETQLTINN